MGLEALSLELEAESRRLQHLGSDGQARAGLPVRLGPGRGGLGSARTAVSGVSSRRCGAAPITMFRPSDESAEARRQGVRTARTLRAARSTDTGNMDIMSRDLCADRRKACGGCSASGRGGALARDRALRPERFVDEMLLAESRRLKSPALDRARGDRRRRWWDCAGLATSPISENTPRHDVAMLPSTMRYPPPPHHPPSVYARARVDRPAWCVPADSAEQAGPTDRPRVAAVVEADTDPFAGPRERGELPRTASTFAWRMPSAGAASGRPSAAALRRVRAHDNGDRHALLRQHCETSKIVRRRRYGDICETRSVPGSPDGGGAEVTMARAASRRSSPAIFILQILHYS